MGSEMMTAAILNQVSSPMRIERIPVPQPRAGEALVRVHACGVCHTDLHVIKGDLAEEVGKLKDQYEGDILIAGSATLVQALIENDLVDELRLMVFPVVLGSGKRLFGETSDKHSLRLTGSQLVGDGVAILKYERAQTQ